MMRYCFWLLIPTITLLSNEKLIYNKELKGQHVEMVWTLEEKDPGYFVKGRNVNSETDITYGPAFVTQEVNYARKNGDFQYGLKRDGSLIKATSTQGGRTSPKTLKLGQELWIQEFDFGLRPFLQTSAKKITFSLVDPKTMKLMKMVATREGVETISVHDVTYLAEKVKITLRGIKSLFWSANVWFDRKSLDLIKYQGDEGPGTAMTTITLKEKSDS